METKAYMVYYRLIICSLFFIPICLGANDGAALFEKANKAYTSNDYPTAITTYQEILKLGLQSSELYYNLGNAYYKNNQLGKSILNYERAARLDPNNKNIQGNLVIARDKVDSAFLEIPDFLPLRLWKSFSGILSPTFWIILQLILGLLMLFGVYSWRIKEDSQKKLKGFSLTVISAILLLISFLAGYTKHKLVVEHKEAIILINTTLKTGADDRSDDLETLSEGVKVKVIDQIDPWYKVSLTNKETGWVEKSDLEII